MQQQYARNSGVIRTGPDVNATDAGPFLNRAGHARQNREGPQRCDSNSLAIGPTERTSCSWAERGTTGRTSSDAFPGRSQKANRDVLIIDDEEVAGLALAEMLKFLDLNPTVCTTAEQALTMARARHFALMFTDIRMPGIDGLSFHRFLSAVHKDLAGRIIFITGDSGNPETKQLIGKTGAICLQKPIHFDELERGIADTLKRISGENGASQPESASAGSPKAGAMPEAFEGRLGLVYDQLALACLETDWSDGLVKGKLDAIDGLLADGFVVSHHSKTLLQRSEYLAALKKRSRFPTDILFEDLQIHVYGDTAVVTARLAAELGKQDEKGHVQYRLTNTWIKQSGGWRCVASHTSCLELSQEIKTPSPVGMVD